MTATELITHLTLKKVDDFVALIRSVPADKLDWKPAPGARSALDQFQEVATILGAFGDVIAAGKLQPTMEAVVEWKKERARITSIDELEESLRTTTNQMLASIAKLRPEQLTDPFESPSPQPITFADMIAMHYWNLSYHEGQIRYILSLTP